jgi:gliding motility-associated-like protein
MNTTYLLRSLKKEWSLIAIISLLFSIFSFTNAYSQNKAADGMGIKVRNFSSFNEKQIRNLDTWRSVNDEGYYDHPDFGTLPENAPCTECVEDLSKREKDLRHFIDINDPSRFYIQRGNGLLHYKENGFWKTIDYRVKPSTVQGVFQSDFYLNNVKFNSVNQKTEIVTPSGSLELNQWSLYKKVNGEEQFISEADWSSYTVGNDGMLIKNIFNGIDAELIIYPGGIKTNFIIKNADFGNYDALIFRDNLTHSNQQPVEVDFKNSEGSNAEVDGIVVSSNGQPLAEFQEAVAYALNGDKESARSLMYVLNNNTIDVEVPSDWIEKYAGDFDLVIDPQVSGSNTLAQASITGSQYNASCNFDNSCDQFLTVPAPANATFDDVLWSFTYEAVGTCWLEDGAVRFATGGCLSPSQAGFYWFCNQTGGGTCAGTNVSVFSDLGGCLPAPSCAPQNVNFTMQFFRTCFGATGCNNACIGAFSPWTMTITGQTIEYTNVTNPITMSSTQVCEGQSLTATTSGQNGVPPYTYNWSFNASGTPSVGVGASTSITFPNSGTETLYSIVTDNCGNQSSASVNITVNPSPTPIITGDTEYCIGQTASISTGSFSSYSWSNGASVQNTNVTDADNSITVTVTNANGCTGTSPPFNVTEVNTITHSETIEVCQGQSATIHGNTETVAGLYEQTFLTGGCDSTASITLVVNALPAITASATETDVCDGGSTTLSANGGDTYIWDNGLGGGQNHTVSPVSTTTYIVTGTDLNGCENTDQIEITVNPLPSVGAGADQTICEGEEVTLSGSGADSYAWDNSVLDGSPFVPGSTNTYTVIGTDANGCENTATVTVNVSPQPNANFTATPTAGLSPLEVDFTDNSSNGTSYEWNFGNGQTETTGTPTNQFTTYSESGSYQVVLTVTNGTCSDNMSVIILVDDLPLSYIIPNVFTPNEDGSNDLLHMDIKNAASLEMEIFNRWGNLVGVVNSTDSEKGWNGQNINTGQPVSDGVYFYTYKIVDLNGEEIEGHQFVHLNR